MMSSRLIYGKHYRNLHPTTKGGCGMGVLVADWITQLIGRPLSRQRGWEYLKKMRYWLRVPRPEHKDSSRQEQEEWKKIGGTPSRKNKSSKHNQMATWRCGQWMNIVLDSNQSFAVFGLMSLYYQLQTSTSDLNGYAYMLLFTPNLGIHIEVVLNR